MFNERVVSMKTDDGDGGAAMTYVDVGYVYENLATQRAQVVDCRASARRRVPGATVVSLGASSTESAERRTHVAVAVVRPLVARPPPTTTTKTRSSSMPPTRPATSTPSRVGERGVGASPTRRVVDA